jgi:ABC-type oligopeptide transport system substrate-binding subunit
MAMKRRLLAIVVVLLLLSFIAGCSPGQPMPTIKYLTDDTENAKKFGQAAVEMIRKNLNIELQMENVDFKTRLSRMRNGQFDIVLAGWNGDYNDPMTFLDMWVTNSPYNDVKWSNAKYDELVKKAQTSANAADRIKAMADAEKILLDELPIIPTHWPQLNYAEHAWVKGILRLPVGAGNDYKFTTTTGRPKGDGILNCQAGAEPPDLRTTTMTDVLSFEIMNTVTEGLVRFDGKDYSQGSGLAESFTVSADGTKYTFKIRDAKWSDGTPVTANDFVYAWEQLVSPLTGSEYSFMAFYIKGAEEISNIKIPDKAKDAAGYTKAMDDLNKAFKTFETTGAIAKDAKTLEVNLKAPTGFFLNLLAFPSLFPVNKTAYEKWGEKYGTEANNTLYCGPFTITEWKHGASLTLKKNPSYWDAKTVKLDTIHYDVLKDVNTPVTMYLANELDWIALGNGEIIGKFQKERPSETKQLPRVIAWYWECNPKHPVLKDKKFRQALSTAFDRTEYTKIMGTFAAPATGLVPTSVAGLTPAESYAVKYVGKILPVTANVAEGQKLLKESLKALGYAVPKAPAK